MICLVGESASGKSTVERELKKHGWQNIISYTTRKPRKGEKDAVDYHFVSENIFNQMKANGEFAETVVYNGWQYGTAKKDCKDDRVIVVNPHGLRQLKKITDLNIISFYINVPRRDRLIKILQRGDNIEEAYRRSVHDDGQFAGIEEEVDFVIDNPRYEYSPKEITKFILDYCHDKVAKKYECLTFNKWHDIKTEKPSENGWYLTTNEFPVGDNEKQKYIMMLYYKDGKWLNNLRRDVFQTYKVMAFNNERHPQFNPELYKQIFTDSLCQRDDVVAWCRLPKIYTSKENVSANIRPKISAE